MKYYSEGDLHIYEKIVCSYLMQEAGVEILAFFAAVHCICHGFSTYRESQKSCIAYGGVLHYYLAGIGCRVGPIHLD